jgi:hypothetical protein
MSHTYIEKRVLEAGKKLCELRIAQKGTLITADDIRSLKIKTFSPVLQYIYGTLGSLIFVLGLWVQATSGFMMISVGLVLAGFLNVVFGVYGRPRPISSIAGLDLMGLTAEIVTSFVDEQEKRLEGKD